MTIKGPKNILVVSYHFFPENTPRAFRTFELVREFARNGNKVHLLLPNKSQFKEQPVNIENVSIDFLGDLIKPSNGNVQVSKLKNSKVRDLLRTVYHYFNPFVNSRPYINQVCKFLSATKKQYDIVISISTPVVCHIGVSLSMLRNKEIAGIPLKIAEYSDPFSNQGYAKMLFVYKYIDRWIGKSFDYIVVPTEKAISSYTRFKSGDRIKVIPQGFDFSEVQVKSYVKNSIPTFAYAGIFYEKIRNPEFLFDFLGSLTLEFKFFVFTRKTNFTVEVLNKYKPLLKGKLEVRFDVPRLALIADLSSMDFLVNIDNDTKDQVPSKLIDYSLTNRPICSITKKAFKEEAFNKFLAGDYTNRVHFDIKDFDIKQVAQKFLEL